MNGPLNEVRKLIVEDYALRQNFFSTDEMFDRIVSTLAEDTPAGTAINKLDWGDTVL